MSTSVHALGTPSKFLVFVALLTVQLLFGVNYVVTKIVVETFPPILWASARIIISSVMMIGVALILKRPFPKGGWKDFFYPLIGFALLGTIINQASFLVGLHYTTPTNSAILNTLIPIFTLIIVSIRGQEVLTSRRLVGFLFAFAGVLALRKIEEFKLSDKTLIGDLLTMLNCLSYGLFLSFSRDFIRRHDRLWVTTWMFIYGSFGLTALASPYWISFSMPEMTASLWGACAFAIFGGTLLAYFLNNWALAYSKPSHVAIFVYVQPIIAAALAWYWMGEVVTLRTVGSSLLIFLGVLLALAQSSQSAQNVHPAKAN